LFSHIAGLLATTFVFVIVCLFPTQDCNSKKKKKKKGIFVIEINDTGIARYPLLPSCAMTYIQISSKQMRIAARLCLFLYSSWKRQPSVIIHAYRVRNNTIPWVALFMSIVQRPPETASFQHSILEFSVLTAFHTLSLLYFPLPHFQSPDCTSKDWTMTDAL